MSGTNGFLIAAYVVMWVGLIGFALRLHRVFSASRRMLEDASREGRGTR